MAEETTSLIKLEPILKQMQEVVPRMQKGSANSVAAMRQITEITSDEDLQNATGVLVAVRNTFDAIQKLRKPITEEFDKLKSELMEFEKLVSQDSKDNEVARIRNLIGAYNQAKLDKKREEELKAQKQKDKENHKVDISSRLKKKLADLLIERVRQVHEGSKKHFDVPLEQFDERAAQFKKFKPVLKKEQYDSCFITDYNKSIVSEEEYIQLVADLQVEETYAKWSELVLEQIVPKVNEWIGRIPELKQKLVDLKNATDEESRLKIEKEQKEKAEQEERESKAEIENMQKASDENIQREAAVDKLQNEFREQAITQQLEDAGPTKLILKFKDDKPVKAICEIIYHNFKHDKFPSIIKLDKDKKPKVDEYGFPVYVDWLDLLVSFFVKYGDVNINGVELKEVTKTIVRAK